MSEDTIEFAVEDGAAVVRLDRLERKNALSEAMVAESTAALERTESTEGAGRRSTASGRPRGRPSS